MPSVQIDTPTGCETWHFVGLARMDPFVQQLADICRAHVTRAKWVFVPTHAVGRTIGERWQIVDYKTDMTLLTNHVYEGVSSRAPQGRVQCR